MAGPAGRRARAAPRRSRQHLDRLAITERAGRVDDRLSRPDARLELQHGPDRDPERLRLGEARDQLERIALDLQYRLSGADEVARLAAARLHRAGEGGPDLGVRE